MDHYIHNLLNGFVVIDVFYFRKKHITQNDDSGVCAGQILHFAISDEEGPRKSILDSKHVEVIAILDAPEDMEVYEKFLGLFVILYG